MDSSSLLISTATKIFMTHSTSDKMFSERFGIDKSKKETQYESINDELKHSMWNIIFSYYLDVGEIPSSVAIQENTQLKKICESVLYDFFKVPGDTIINGYLSNAIERIREMYYDLEWNKVYDFVEFLANMSISNGTPSSNKDDHFTFTDTCNKILKRENSGYQFVNNKISKIDKQQ